MRFVCKNHAKIGHFRVKNAKITPKYSLSNQPAFLVSNKSFTLSSNISTIYKNFQLFSKNLQK